MNSWSKYVGQDIADRYRLESLLGVGSFGPVYAARDSKARQAVMLRLLPAELGGNSAFDATVLTDFRHPQAVAVSEVGEFEETRYVVMPHAVGQRIQVRDPWPVERVLDFVRQVSTPLVAFHKQYDLQHLHLHPGNVFVDESSGKPQFQIADLGLASQVGAGTLILAAIRERRTTPEFLSPEQLQGNVPSSQSDVYAFGAMVFQLFSGLPPFPYSGESLAAYALHVAKTPPPRFRDVSDQLNIDPYLESIILRCLAKKPEGRPGSIKEFVESYEMAYRDFQTRTLSGLKLSQLEEARPNEFSGANPPSPMVGQIPSNPSLPPSVPSPASLPKKPAAPAALPASDMLPSTFRPPVRNDQIPYRALPHGTDTQFELPRGSGASRAVQHESEAILQSVSPQLSPWLGMGGEASKPDTPNSQPSTDVLPANSVPPRPVAPPLALENRTSHEQPMGTLLSNDSPSAFASRVAEPPHREASSAPPPATDQRPRESERDQSPSVNSRVIGSRTPINSDQTMSPSFEPLPQSPSEFDSRSDSNLTMQMQQDWLRSQLPAAAPRSIAPASPTPARFESKASGPPKVVLVLAVAILVAAGSALFYGRVIAQRVGKVVDKCVAKKDFKQAKTTLQQLHPLARVWLNPEKEIQQLLTDGVERVAELRTERNVAEAVLLTGQLDAAFVLKSQSDSEESPKLAEEPLKDVEEPRRIRQEVAQELRKDVLSLASQKRLDEAWTKLNGEVATEFRKVAKMLSAESSDFDVKAVKREIVQKGFELAKQHTAEGQHAEAFKVLDPWLKRFGTDDAIDPLDKEKLKAEKCEARVRMTLLAATEESRPDRRRFPEAIEMLDKLLGDLDRDSCAQHRPAVLLARGQIKLALAETKSDSVTETAKRFENSRKDFDDTLSALGQQPTNTPVPPTKSDVLQARSVMWLARGLWHKSRDSKDRPTQPLLEALRDFKAALADVPNLVEAQRHLKEIRESAQSPALEAFNSAQATRSPTEADQHYCEAIRQLTLVIEGSLLPEDDGMARSARLLRGLASSSLKSPDYENGIADLSQAVIEVSESQFAEVSEHLAADFDAEQRIHWARRWVAVARGRLAWLVATCDQTELREQAKTKIRPVDLAVLAVRSLEELVLDSQRGVVKAGDSNASVFLMDRGEAWKSHVATLMDAGDFKSAIERILIAQSNLDPKDSVWKADLSADLEQFQVAYAKKELPFRMKSPIGSVRPCPQE